MENSIIEELWLGDCLELMDKIPDKSIDMILCDLPYGTTACSWDVIIPFDKLWQFYERIISPIGAIVLNSTQPFTSLLIASNINLFKYNWVWIKNRPTNFAHAKNKPMKKHEDICVFSKGTTVHQSQSSQRMNYFPQGLIDVKPKLITKSIKEKTNVCFSNRPSHSEFTRNKTNYPHSVLEFSTDQLGLHPTAKPLALCEYLIKTYTNVGDLVLDNCMGSGTTCLAARNLGRKFIGIEKDPQYYEVSKQRIFN